jgi:hypothetical protein
MLWGGDNKLQLSGKSCFTSHKLPCKAVAAATVSTDESQYWVFRHTFYE